MGGLRTAPGQFEADKLYWSGFQAPIIQRAGTANIREAANGGKRISSPQVAAEVMNDVYTGRLGITERLDIPRVDNATAMRIMSDVNSLNGGMTLKLSQRLFDMRSSYDLRCMANLVYNYLGKTGFSISPDDLADPMMTNLLNLPGCSILGCDFGPTYEITGSGDPDLLIYDAGKFMGDQVVFNRKTDSFRLDGRGMVEFSKEGKPYEKAILPYVFPYLFSQAGLSGLSLHMTDYNPLTALGGMGMSNLLVFKTLVGLHFLLNTGTDIGTIFSQGGYVEKFKFDRETGYQEAQQVVSGGHLLIANAPGMFGGIARRLDLTAHHQEITDNMHLVLYNRPAANVNRAPINDSWVRQAADPRFEQVYMDQFRITGREVLPFLQAANGGRLILDDVASAFREHSETRFTCCYAYHGNAKQAAFINSVHGQGGAAFPLGEGGEKAAMLLALGNPAYEQLGLRALTVDDANQETGFITGEIKDYNLLNNAPVYGNGYETLAGTGKYGFATPPLVVSGY